MKKLTAIIATYLLGTSLISCVQHNINYHLLDKRLPKILSEKYKEKFRKNIKKRPFYFYENGKTKKIYIKNDTLYIDSIDVKH